MVTCLDLNMKPVEKQSFLRFCSVPLTMHNFKSAAPALHDLVYKLQRGSKGRRML